MYEYFCTGYFMGKSVHRFFLLIYCLNHSGIFIHVSEWGRILLDRRKQFTFMHHEYLLCVAKTIEERVCLVFAPEKDTEPMPTDPFATLER